VRINSSIGIASCLLAAVTFTALTGCPTAQTKTESGVVVACLPPAGGSSAPASVAADVPGEVTFVVQNRATFTQQPDNAFAQVEPGTLVDALSNLNGCYGVYYVLAADGKDPQVPAGTPVLDAYELYSFDPATGAAKFQLYEHAVTGGLWIFVAYEGHYALGDTNQINVTWNTVTYSDPDTNEVKTETFTGTEAGSKAALRATLSGDQFRVRAETATGTDCRIFVRFTCP
jgi:hypothetical protein